MVTQKLRDRFYDLEPQALNLAKTPPASSPISLIPFDIRLIGLKIMVGSRLSIREKRRIDSYRGSDELLQTLVRRRLGK